MVGPSGQKVSKDLARDHWPPPFFPCHLLADTSFAPVTPKTAFSASCADASRTRLPMTMAISASKSTSGFSRATEGIDMLASAPITEAGFLKA
eukprot:CAMPEP_0169333000 /NCGR_PEP_ID=MMETSP1017-20121227/15025_1 /TAXON_ID=342587 /ORGANISM="Karlodinium micrum, Strain CCMP2283" /LENGTH=92 /DNA_ID=CAMNT_0009428191 /DNA_START=291 /DNA_END=569 /DNA_ORIENTATION=+